MLLVWTCSFLWAWVDLATVGYLGFVVSGQNSVGNYFNSQQQFLSLASPWKFFGSTIITPSFREGHSCDRLKKKKSERQSRESN